MTEQPALFVEAPARLHFGVLDLRGDLGRRFGGIGAAVPAPSLLLEARAATSLSAEGPDAARVLEPLVKTFPHSGQIAQALFAVGIVSLGMLAIPVMAGSTPTRWPKHAASPSVCPWPAPSTRP